jgi:hypothetical protein
MVVGLEGKTFCGYLSSRTNVAGAVHPDGPFFSRKIEQSQDEIRVHKREISTVDPTAIKIVWQARSIQIKKEP